MFKKDYLLHYWYARYVFKWDRLPEHETGKGIANTVTSAD